MSQRPIYLERIEISNFRSHGKSELRIPPEPGVVLLVGMNGLGKTNLFEAIEWALTGTVRRLEAFHLTRTALQDALRRTGSRRKPRVALDFGAAGRITRDSTHHPSPDAIARLLAAEEWQHTIADPATYLALTHILPQSPQVRFSQRDPKEQWEMLKVPAGVERLDTLALRLSGQALQGEFDRVIETIGKSVADQRAVVVRWDDRQKEIERLRALATGHASLTRQEIQTRARRLQERWLRPSKGGRSASGDLAQSFRQLGSQFATQKQRIATAEVRVAIALRIVQEWNGLQENLATLNAAREALRQQTDATEAALRASLERRDAAAAALGQAEEDQVVAQKRLVDARQLLTAMTGAAEAARSLVATNNTFAAVDREVAALNANLAEAERLRTQAEAARVALTEIDRQLTQLARLEQSHRSAMGAEDRAAQARRELEGLAARLVQARADDRNYTAEIRRLQGEISAHEERASQVRSSVQKLSDAVAEVAAHLSASDVVCPICQHVHPPAELQRLASQSATAAAPALVALNAESAELRRRLAANVEAQRGAAQQIAGLEEQTRSFEEILRAAGAERSELETHPLLAGLSWDQVPARLLALGTELARGRRENEAQLRAVDNGTATQAAALQGRITNVRQQRERLVEEEHRLQAVIAQHDATIRSRGELFAQAGGVPERLASIVDSLHDAAEQAGNRLTGERQRRALAVQECQRHEAERAAALARHAHNAEQSRALEVSHNDARKRWREAGFEGDPATTTVTGRRSELQRDIEAVNEGLATLDQLMKAEEVWHRQEQLAVLEATCARESAAAGADDASTHRQKLLVELQSTEDRLKVTAQAKALAMRVADALRDTSETYNAQVLKPLTARIDSFHRALSPFPEYSFGAHVHTYERQRTGFELTMHAPNLGRSDAARNPQTRLSEGQISALGVCVLLAASTSYRWSRWRALLLDDPFQHTDLIHSAALIDVLRKLTRLDDGYQIILSTHDLEEAEFIRRKCEAAKIKFLRCTLLGLTSTGLRWERGAEFGPQ